MFTSIVLPGDTKIRELTPEGIAEYLNTAPQPDIWVFDTPGTAPQPLRPADPAERTRLFDELQLPQVTVFPVQKTSKWLVLPANKNAYRKSVKAEIPLPLTFAPDNISMFDPILARVYKQRRVWLLYEDVNERYPTRDVEKARALLETGLKTSLRSVIAALSGLQQELAVAVDFALQTSERPIESMCKYALRLSGAALEKLTDLGGGQYDVTYNYKGRTDSVVIDDTLTVVNAKICLDGTDKQHDLSTIVFVKEEKDHYHEDDY